MGVSYSSPANVRHSNVMQCNVDNNAAEKNMLLMMMMMMMIGYHLYYDTRGVVVETKSIEVNHFRDRQF